MIGSCSFPIPQNINLRKYRNVQIQTLYIIGIISSCFIKAKSSVSRRILHENFYKAILRNKNIRQGFGYNRIRQCP